MGNMTEKLFAQSHIHQAVLVEAAKALSAEGQFRKLDLMAAVGDVAMVDFIRWDWILKKILETTDKLGGGVSLIAVAESFFKADAKKKAAMHTDWRFKHEDSFPGKYIAQGHGKRTAGWVLGTFADGRFALYKAGLMKGNADGKQKKLEAFGKAITRNLVAQPDPGKATEIARIAGLKKLKVV